MEIKANYTMRPKKLVHAFGNDFRVKEDHETICIDMNGFIFSSRGHIVNGDKEWVAASPEDVEFIQIGEVGKIVENWNELIMEIE